MGVKKNQWGTGLKISFCFLLSFGLIVLLNRIQYYQRHGFEAPKPQTYNGYRVGNLGGMPVNIKANLIQPIVEYDGDPSVWTGEPRNRVARTYESKINSFGFEMRYTDGAMMTWREREADIKNNYPLYNHPWVDVVISSGESYPRSGDGFLDRVTKRMTGENNYQGYEKLPQKEYGLEVYAWSGIDPKTKLPRRQNRDAKDLFIYRNVQGKVLAYITCSNVVLASVSCIHTFSMEEAHLKIKVSVLYNRRFLLPEWRKIQEKVSEVILSFRASQSVAAELVLPNKDQF
jgi:hypothetical protein